MQALSPEETSATLAHEPEAPLWKEYARTQCPLLRGELESRYLHLVDRLARQLMQKLPGCVDVHDLMQEGFMGLRRAVERFQMGRKVKFTTYAQSAIWGAMMDSLRRDDFTSRNARRHATLMQETRGLLAQEFGRPPTDEELADALGLEGDQTANLARLPEVTSENVLGSHGDDRRLQLEDTHAADPAMEAQRREMRELLLRGFPAQERLLIILYYFEELTMREIGATLGISESRVSQLHTLVVGRIKSDMKRKRVLWE